MIYKNHVIKEQAYFKYVYSNLNLKKYFYQLKQIKPTKQVKWLVKCNSFRNKIKIQLRYI